MSSVNRITLIGRLGADPEIRYTQGGQPVCNLRVATTENWNDRDGNRQERTEWHGVTVWGKQGELCGQYLAKGRQVYLEGRLQSREYTDRDGVNRKVWEVVASNVVFLGSRGDSPGGNWGGGNQGGGNAQGGGWGGNQGGGNTQGGGWGGNQGGGNSQGGGWGGNQGGGNAQGGGNSQGGGWGGNQGGGWGSAAQPNSQPPAQNAPAGGPDDDDPIPF